MGVYKSRLSNKMLVLLIIMCLSVIFFYMSKKNENVVPTFNEYEINNKTYIINLDNNITTRNLDGFNDSEIVAIYPNISSKYDKIVNSGWFYIDKTKSFKSNINKFEQYYQNIFEYNKILNESLEIEYNGLSIKKIKVSTDNINQYSKYKIENS
ncbi:MAG: hypothetical protein IJ094_02425 [Bacilli bacterium]|nr:hypothetical protein [Bacilli bacterium]